MRLPWFGRRRVEDLLEEEPEQSIPGWAAGQASVWPPPDLENWKVRKDTIYDDADGLTRSLKAIKDENA